MLTFTKQTTSEDENTIESTSSKMRGMGFNGDIIVYRNQVDVALSVVALASLKLAGNIARAHDNDGKFAIIATSTYEDGKIIRDQVEKMRETMAPFFGVATEEPKEEPKPAAPTAPRKALNP